MQKELFTKEHLDPYRNDPLIKSSLNGMALLNCDEFLTWYNFSTETRSPKSDKDMVLHLQEDLLDHMPEGACGNKIGIDYGMGAIINIVKPRFDILVAVARDYDTLKRQEFSTKARRALQWKIKHILGFIIVEKGECKKLPNTYSVNLICTRANLEYKQFGKKRALQREKVRGAILMGGYMYCAKKLYAEKPFEKSVPIHTSGLAPLHSKPGLPPGLAPPPGLPPLRSKPGLAPLHNTPGLAPLHSKPGLPVLNRQPVSNTPVEEEHPMGILELAGGYTNINGFFSYSKMGFKKDLSLFDGKCFKDYGNLPMSVDLNKLEYDKIITLASGTEKLTDFGDDTDFMQLLPKTERQSVIQQEIARIYNIIYQMPYVLNSGHALIGKEANIMEDFENEYYDYYGNDPHTQPPALEDYLDFLYNQLDIMFNDYYKKSPSKTLRRARSLSLERRPNMRATLKRGRSE